MRFHPFDSVRITRLLTPAREVDSGTAPPAQPRVGDTGTVVETLGDGLYLVERVTDDGRTVWLAEFDREELTLLDRPPARD